MPLQEWIHKLEVGEGTRVIRWLVAVLCLGAMMAVYDYRAYKNFSTPEAMDAAQLARNLSEGRGFTTDFIRPFSIHLLEGHASVSGNKAGDAARLKTGHPDLANPPLYPLALAVLMKLLPFDYGISTTSTAPFRTHQPEMIITGFNQFLFLVAVGLVFVLARKLFDDTVAWISAVILAGTELLWRFSASGLPIMLVLVIFLALVSTLVAMDLAAREGTRKTRWLVLMALLAGVLTGLAGLTRYSFGWLIVPVVIFVSAYFPGRRTALCVAASIGFLVVLTPWVARNYQLSGMPFGVATYAMIEETPRFPADRLQRSLKPDYSEVTAMDCVRKLAAGLRTMVQNDLPRLGGSWATALFLAGLFVPFSRPGLSRLRVFLLISLGLMSVVEALARTHPVPDAPEVSNDNLLIVFVPLVIIYGIGLYSILVSQLDLRFPSLRILINGLVVVVVSAPLILTLLPRTYPLAYPPYYPPLIQRFANWMRSEELVMSDMPWAVAWYARNQSVWITLNVQDPGKGEDFYSINDLKKPVKGLYLTHLTLDQRFFSQVLAPQGNGWGRFVIDAVVSTNLPSGFPLKQAPVGYLPNGQLFLTDWQRWQHREK